MTLAHGRGAVKHFVMGQYGQSAFHRRRLEGLEGARGGSRGLPGMGNAMGHAWVILWAVQFQRKTNNDGAMGQMGHVDAGILSAATRPYYYNTNITVVP